MISETAEVERIANYTEEFTRDLQYRVKVIDIKRLKLACSS